MVVTMALLKMKVSISTIHWAKYLLQNQIVGSMIKQAKTGRLLETLP